MGVDNRQFLAESGGLGPFPLLLPTLALEENEVVPRGTIPNPSGDPLHRAHRASNDCIRLHEINHLLRALAQDGHPLKAQLLGGSAQVIGF